MQLFNLKFPANASFLVRFLVDVATFDVISIEMIWYFFEFPDRGAYNLNFSSSGYEYLHVIENLGTSVALVQLYFFSCFLCLVMYCLKHKHERINRYYEKMRNFLFWGAALRFVFEAYLEISVCTTIGIATMEWKSDNFAIFYNNLFNIGLAAVLLIMPFFTSLFYYFNADNMDDEEFEIKFGTLYSGLNLDLKENKRKSALFFPFFFVIRRLLFLVAAIFLNGFLWGQLAIQFFCSVTMIIYLGTYEPFEDPIFTKIELMNEITSVFLLYHMFCFTDWVPNASDRYIMGWSFICFTSLNLICHLVILARDQIFQFKYKILKRCKKLTPE